MNKMPDRIWATPFDSDMDGGTYCDAAERPTSPNHDAWCYVRADLARAEAAEAERDRLREALEKLECKCSSNCDWLHDDVCPSWIARAALKGESHD